MSKEFIWTDELVFEFSMYNTIHPREPNSLQDFKESKEIKEENKSNDSFQWTRELVEELVWDKFGNADVRFIIDLFEKEHTPKPQAENPEYVQRQAYSEWLKEKQDREDIIKPYNKPDYEIVAFKNDVEGVWVLDDHPFDKMMKKRFMDGVKMNWQIHTVKRLSDGEVFSVGDEVDIRDGEDDKWHNNPSKIIKFKIWELDNDMIAEVMPNGETSSTGSVARDLNDLKKLPPQPQKLFTTEDGKDIYEGDKYWYVQHEFKIKSVPAANKLSGQYVDFKYFSTEEKVKEYVKINKPLNISFIEIASCITNYVKAGEPTYKGTAVIDFEKLDNLIKSKTNG